jgi:hypothetical protein
MFPVVALQEGDVTTLIRMSETEEMAPLARELHPGFQFVSDAAHFDGVYYFAIALDPLATKEAHELIDLAAYRYSHPGYGWLAWLASFGQPSYVAAALAVLGLLSISVASAIGALVSKDFGWSPWGGLFVALNPGLIHSASVDTGEAFGVALLGLILLAWRRRRWGWVCALAIALCLTKEMFLFVCAGLFIWRLIEAYVKKERTDFVKPLAAVSAGPIAYAGWQLYLSTRFELFPYGEVPQAVFFPLEGWAESFMIAAGFSTSTADTAQVGMAALPLLSAAAVLLALGLYRAFRFRSVVDPIYILLTLFASTFGPILLAYPKDLIRLVSTQLLLVPLALLGDRSTSAKEEPIKS